MRTDQGAENTQIWFSLETMSSLARSLLWVGRRGFRRLVLVAQSLEGGAQAHLLNIRHRSADRLDILLRQELEVLRQSVPASSA